MIRLTWAGFKAQFLFYLVEINSFRTCFSSPHFLYNCSLSLQEMLDKANKMLDFNLLDLCLKGPETELERLGVSKRWAKKFPRGLAWNHIVAAFSHSSPYTCKHEKSS